MVRADSLPRRYATEFTNGSHVGHADATEDKGGGGQGFRPHDLLEAALATCMSMSLRMYADRNGIPLQSAHVRVSLDRSAPDAAVFSCSVGLTGELSGEQEDALLQALETCPVRTTLSKPLRFACSRDGLQTVSSSLSAPAPTAAFSVPSAPHGAYIDKPKGT